MFHTYIYSSVVSCPSDLCIGSLTCVFPEDTCSYFIILTTNEIEIYIYTSCGPCQIYVYDILGTSLVLTPRDVYCFFHFFPAKRMSSSFNFFLPYSCVSYCQLLSPVLMKIFYCNQCDCQCQKKKQKINRCWQNEISYIN